MGLSYISRILYSADGFVPGRVYYFRVVKKSSGLIWDNTNKVLATNPVWEDSAMLTTPVGETGGYEVIFPADLPAGVFDIIIYLQAGSAPSNTDTIVRQYDQPRGDIFGF